MKKFIALFLVLLMTLSVFFACKAEDYDESSVNIGNSDTASKDDSDNSSVSVDNKHVNDNGDYIVGLEKKDFNQREFRILVKGFDSVTYQSNDFTADSDLYGDTLNVGVAERNRKIEEAYNVKLTVFKNDGIASYITSLFQSGDDLYDVIMPNISSLINLAQEGRLYDLKTISTIDLDAPWWDQNANEAFSIGNKLFLTLGDITILNKVCTPTVIFNKDMIVKLKLENPYDLVREHKWTFDKMYEMATEATFDLDGIDGISVNDNWGLLTGPGDLIGFYGAANQTLCKKDDHDLPYVTLTDEASINIAQYILGKLNEKGTWAIFAQAFPSDIWVTSLAAFSENRVLFRPSGFSAMAKLRASEVEFGIIPLPLWNEEQEDYVSYCGTGQVAGAAIPITCNDAEFAGYMLEIYSCEAKNYITPAYVEVNIKSKDTRDDESLEMLNIIFGNIVYDIGEIYNFGKSGSSGIASFLSNLVTNNKTEIVSSYEAIKNVVESDINTVITNYENY